MELGELRAACVGKNDQTIKNLILGTDEYLFATQSGASEEALRDFFNTGVLLVRGFQGDAGAAVQQAAQQRTVADSAEKIANSGQEWTWVPSGPFKDVLEGKNDSFVKFLMGDVQFQPDNPKTRLNCWEAVIVAAMYSGVLGNGTGLVNLYQQGPVAFSNQLTYALTSGAGHNYVPGRLLQSPVRGDIVLFDGLAHVAIATGESDQTGSYVLSFWPAPVKSVKEFGPDGTPTAMLLCTIEALGAWMNLVFGQVPQIRFGSPSWQLLNQQ